MVTVFCLFLFVSIAHSGAQQRISQSDINASTNINVHSNFMPAGRVDVEWEINFVEIPDKLSRQVLLRVKGRISNNAVVVSCNVTDSALKTSGRPCQKDDVQYSSDYIRTAHKTVSGGDVFFQRINFSESSGQHNVAIDFSYL